MFHILDTCFFSVTFYDVTEMCCMLDMGSRHIWKTDVSMGSEMKSVYGYSVLQSRGEKACQSLNSFRLHYQISGSQPIGS